MGLHLFKKSIMDYEGNYDNGIIFFIAYFVNIASFFKLLSGEYFKFIKNLKQSLKLNR